MYFQFGNNIIKIYRNHLRTKDEKDFSAEIEVINI